MDVSSKHVLVTVLDWGLGHATRSIPVIRELVRRNIRITLAGEGPSLDILKTEFPGLPCRFLPGIQVRYPDSGKILLWTLKQPLRFLIAIRKEHREFSKLVQELKPDAIISDNRYGAFSHHIPSFLICHQLNLQLPAGLRIFKPLLDKLYLRLLKPFTEVWIPDVDNFPGLGGILSHSKNESIKKLFIGPLSRIEDEGNYISDIGKRYDILVVIGGPEPQRSILEKRLLKELSLSGFSAIVLPGRPPGPDDNSYANIRIACNMPASEIRHHLMQSRYIVGRPGYSTLMDLCSVKRSALCIPTPGQTEQEYLGKLHSQAGHILTVNQNEKRILSFLPDLEKCKVFSIPVNKGISNAIDRLTELIN